MNNIVASLDIGSSKVCAIVAEVNKSQFNVLGVGTSESKGVKKGVIVDIDSTVDAIKSAIKQAENMSNKDVKSVFTSIYGGYTTLYDNHGIIAVSGEKKEITNDDIRRVVEAAKIIDLPPDKEIIDIVPEQYIIDGSEGVRDPRGMSGDRLEVDASIVTAQSTFVQNIINTINKSGYEVDGIVLQPIAESNIVLNSDEKNLGVAMIDIGAETTDITIFENGRLLYNTLIPVGGNNVTNDISIICKIPHDDAEKIKKQYAIASEKLITNDEVIKINKITGYGEKELKYSDVAKIMDDRIFEILNLIKKCLQSSGLYNEIGAGVVITGGGLFNIKGITEVAKNVIGLPVRFGYPNFIGVANPVYSSSTGTALYMLKRRKTSKITSTKKVNDDDYAEEVIDNKEQSNSNIIHKIREFFADFF